MSDGDGASNVGTQRPFQFSLRQLLWATVACAFACALVFQWGWTGFATCYIVAYCLALFWGVYWRAWEYVFGGIAAIVLGGCMGPLFSSPRVTSRRMICGNNIRQIAIALQNYHDALGTFPPAYIADADGKPMHSWRMLILPFLEQKNLYDLYDFSEPWDGPNNSKLAAEFPRLKIFMCASSTNVNETNYFAVVGQQTIWPDERAAKLSDIKDGAASTIQIVEVHNTGIHWMEPRDLDFVQMPMSVNPTLGQGISSAHQGGAMVALADGSSRFIKNETSPKTLRGLLTIAGGETIEDY